MSCRCLKGKRLSGIKRGAVKSLIGFIRKHPETFSLLAELVNSFRPTDSDRVIAERIFLTVREMSEIGVLNFRESSELMRLLKGFFLHSTDRRRGDFLEAIVSKLGPFFFSERSRRVNQCKVFKGYRAVSMKEIDVAFSARNFLELHECKSNMGRQWRDPLYPRTRKGGKLDFLNSLKRTCRNGRKVIPVCSGLDGKLSVEAVRQTFREYGYRNIRVMGRGEIEEKLRR